LGGPARGRGERTKLETLVQGLPLHAEDVRAQKRPLDQSAKWKKRKEGQSWEDGKKN